MTRNVSTPAARKTPNPPSPPAPVLPPGDLQVEGAQRDGGGGPGGGGPGSVRISRREGEPWGMGVTPDPIQGVVITEV